MNFLDIRTVLFCYVISSAVCTIVIGSLWQQNHKRSPGLGFWLADFLMQFAALVLIISRGVLPDFLSMVLSNFMILAGTLLLYIGLEQYTRKVSVQWFNYLYLAVFVITQVYFVYIQPSLMARNINISLGLLVICSQCAWLLLRRVDSIFKSDTWRAGVFFGVFSLVSLIRIGVDLTVPSGNDFFKSGLYDTLAILIYQMLYIGLTFNLILMVNQRLFTALEIDIEERKQAEAALKKSEEKFSVAFLNIPDALLITSMTDGKIIEANESFFRISGFSREESLGRTTIELDLWCSLSQRSQVVDILQKQGRLQNFETEFRRKSGELFTGWISSELIQLQGQTCILNVIQDITERKQAEDALRESEARFRVIFEHANDAIHVDNINDEIIQVNPRMCEMMGYSREELIKMRVADLQAPEVRGKPGEVIQDELTRHEKSTFEGLNLHRSGRRIPVEITVSRFESAQGNMVVSIVRDITQRKRADEILKSYSENLEAEVDQRTRELREAQDQIRRQERLATLGQLAGSIGHELRNPLGIISNAVYFLKMASSNVNNEIMEYLDIIDNETHASVKIINDLLDFTRIKSMNRESVNVSQLVGQTMERYNVPPSVTVNLDLAPELLLVYADPQHLNQVLGNLITNACQAMPKGGNLIITSWQEQSNVAISVRDTGVGIPPENISKIFEPLFTTKSEGIGLGLAVSRNLVEANGGCIEVQSELGKGSLFTLYLPVFRGASIPASL